MNERIGVLIRLCPRSSKFPYRVDLRDDVHLRRLGFLVNMHANEIADVESGAGESVLDLYFQEHVMTTTFCFVFVVWFRIC